LGLPTPRDSSRPAAPAPDAPGRAHHQDTDPPLAPSALPVTPYQPSSFVPIPSSLRHALVPISGSLVFKEISSTLFFSKVFGSRLSQVFCRRYARTQAGPSELSCAHPRKKEKQDRRNPAVLAQRSLMLQAFRMWDGRTRAPTFLLLH